MRLSFLFIVVHHQSKDVDEFFPLQPLLPRISLLNVNSKYTLSIDTSINVTIITSIHLALHEDQIPVSKPIISLVENIYQPTRTIR